MLSVPRQFRRPLSSPLLAPLSFCLRRQTRMIGSTRKAAHPLRARDREPLVGLPQNLVGSHRAAGLPAGQGRRSAPRACPPVRRRRPPGRRGTCRRPSARLRPLIGVGVPELGVQGPSSAAARSSATLPTNRPQCRLVSASSWVSGAVTRQAPTDVSKKSRAANGRVAAPSAGPTGTAGS
jgi:hypothetical protein